MRDERPNEQPSLPLDVPEGEDSPSTEQPHRQSRFAGRDGVTAKEREQPPHEAEALIAMEDEAASARPDQLTLFTEQPDGEYVAFPDGLAALEASSSLTLARTWFRQYLEATNRPRNTIESYSYDLTVLEGIIGPKPIDRITKRDIARYLGEATNKTTRKRRLTSIRRLMRYLIDIEKVIKADPTEGYVPHMIALRSPHPLFRDEQEAYLAAAIADEPWSGCAVWLMMRLGITRSELLRLRRDDIDRTEPGGPAVYIYYDRPGKQVKERKLATNVEFAELYDAYLELREPVDLLFPVGPQAVNGMVERVRQAAGITKEVTPQTLRHTFAVEAARQGATQQQLLGMLGLANDPRNRASVDRYIRMAMPAENADFPGEARMDDEPEPLDEPDNHPSSP